MRRPILGSYHLEVLKKKKKLLQQIQATLQLKEIETSTKVSHKLLLICCYLHVQNDSLVLRPSRLYTRNYIKIIACECLHASR